MQTEKNPFVEVCRFLAAVWIAGFHLGTEAFREGGPSRAFPGGWLFVEFFLLLSGYFMARRVWRNDLPKEEHAEFLLSYATGRYFRLVDLTALAATLCYGVYVAGERLPWKQAVESLYMLPFEALMLRGTGVMRAAQQGCNILEL